MDTTATEKLRAAAVLIGEAMDTLNAETVPCDTCGRTHAKDLIEFKAHTALTTTRQKILDWADTLYLPPDQRGDSPAARRAKERKR